MAFFQKAALEIFLRHSPHHRPALRVPDKIAKVLARLPARPLLLHGGHDEGLCSPQSTVELFFPLLPSFLSTSWRHLSTAGCIRAVLSHFKFTLVACTLTFFPQVKLNVTLRVWHLLLHGLCNHDGVSWRSHLYSDVLQSGEPVRFLQSEWQRR